MHKDKAHTFEKVVSAIKQFVLRHNFGTYAMSLHHKFGTMNSARKRHYQNFDKKTQRAASYKWIPSPLRHKKKRQKTSKLAQSKVQEFEPEGDIIAFRHSVLTEIRGTYRAGQGDGPLLDCSDDEIDYTASS